MRGRGKCQENRKRRVDIRDARSSRILLTNPDYDAALIGVSIDNRAVYDYSKMLECRRADGMTDDEAVEFIEYNTMRAIAYAGPAGPIIFHMLE